MYDNISNIITNSKNIFENKINNQSSLFGEEDNNVSFLINDKNSLNWPNDEILSNEFESVGFFISNHPLDNYLDLLEENKIKSFKDFESNIENECSLAGTILSIKERKTAKGTSFAIIKFSDLSKVYEIFLFSEMLEKNRANLKEGKSFKLTVIRDKVNKDNKFRRLNVRNIIALNDIKKAIYSDVFIELSSSKRIKDLYKTINEKGDSKIKISIEENNKNYLFELKDKRKFNYKMLKLLNNEPYIKKITV